MTVAEGKDRRLWTRLAEEDDGAGVEDLGPPPTAPPGDLDLDLWRDFDLFFPLAAV